MAEIRNMLNDVEILISKEELEKKIKELGEKITQDYKDKDLLLVGVLRGSAIFYADLAREIDLPLHMNFIAASSYGSGTVSSGAVRINYDLDEDIAGKNVVIVEDIIDTGLTLKYLVETLQARNPASIKTCALLDKPERRKVEFTCDYTGFVIPDEFVVGYGIDYDNRYRNLDFVAILKREVYENK